MKEDLQAATDTALEAYALLPSDVSLARQSLALALRAGKHGDNLSMFYISPYYPTQLPLLGAVQAVSYPLFVVCYLLFFNGFSLIVWGVTKLIRRLRKEQM